MALASLRPNQLKPHSRISDVLATEWLTPSPEVGASQLRRQVRNLFIPLIFPTTLLQKQPDSHSTLYTFSLLQ
jgi:hypothetical protein